MSKKASVWQDRETATSFLESERGAVPTSDLQLDIIDRIIRHWLSYPSRFLDLGCGDGIIGRYLLEKYPDTFGVFIDFSDTMLCAASEKLGNQPNSKIIKLDFSTHNWIDSIKKYTPFDVIVSGFAIHHQPDAGKKQLYSEIYDLLSPGGVFLNLEHVASSTPETAMIFEDFYIDSLVKFQQKINPRTKREKVAESFKDRADKYEDKLTPVESQCKWLNEIGFTDVDCFFKLFEISIFGGRKP